MTNVNSSAEPIISFLAEETGFMLNDKKKEELSFFIKERSHKNSAGVFERYLDHIKSPNGSEELMNLIDFLAVGETFFFRNKKHWQALKRFVLPKILDTNRDTRKKLKFWSAGCCTGEEAYTIAIVLKEAFPVTETWDIEIIATDINQTSIEKAREGLYCQNSFRSEDSYFIERYFLKEQGQYRISEEIQEMVTFEQLNLVSKTGFPSKHKEYDVIFCRNVLMYFHPTLYDEIIKKFACSLKEEGFLFLGHAEMMIAENTVFKPVIYDGTFIFQKIPNKDHKPEAKSQGLNSREPADGKPQQTLSNQQHTGIKGSLPLPHHTSCTGGQQVKNKHYLKSNRQRTTEEGEHTSITDHYREALKYYYQENYAAALNRLSRAQDENKDSIKVLILKALICITTLNLTTAEACYKKALKLSDISPEVHQLEALIKEAARDYRGAIKANQAAIFLDSNFFTPHFRLVHIYQKKGNAKKASQFLTNALKTLKTDDEERVKLFCGGFSKKLLEDICRQRCQL